MGKAAKFGHQTPTPEMRDAVLGAPKFTQSLILYCKSGRSYADEDCCCALRVVVCCVLCVIRIESNFSDEEEDCRCVLFAVCCHIQMKIRCSDEEEDCCCVSPHPNSSLGRAAAASTIPCIPSIPLAPVTRMMIVMMIVMMTMILMMMKVMMTKVMIMMGDAKGSSDTKCCQSATII